MAENRGKKFEQQIKKAFLKVPGVSIDRIHDQTARLKGSQNICDFIVYKKPYEYYFECKSVHGNTLPFSNITDTQWNGLLEKSKIPGVHAGIICWWIDKDATGFFPIQMLQDLRDSGEKSLNINGDWQDFYDTWAWHWIPGKKKKVFFEYDMIKFLEEEEYRFGKENNTKE